MSCILHIESTTTVCSVALSQDGACLFEKANYDGPQHNTLLASYAEEALSFADSHAIPLDAVAVSCGRVLIPGCVSAFLRPKVCATAAMCR